MPVTFQSGDLFATPEVTAFGHGCNCIGSMGAGIAVAFRKRWPQMFQEYKALCDNERFVLGDVFTWTDGRESVFNLATQQTTTTPAELAAIDRAVTAMVRAAEAQNIREIALPRIGAGLGRLPWSEVRNTLIQIAKSTDVQLRVCETFVEGQPLRTP